MHSDQRNCLARLFSPESLALAGFSNDYGGIDGRFFLTNLHRADFPGRLYLVDPNAREINGMRTYPKLTALPEMVDLAIICTPASGALSALSECAQREISNVHLIIYDSEKFRRPEAVRLEREILRESSKGGLNVIGPNCLGPYAPKSRLIPWGQIPADSGRFAFISQSDDLAERMTQHAHFTGFGISKAVSIGKGTVLDSTEYLEYLAEDEETHAIGVYVDGVREAKRFLQIARVANQRKPLFIWKAGEATFEAGEIDSDPNVSRQNRIWENGIRQSGVTRVRSLEEMAGTAAAFLNLPPPKGRRVFILGGGGGNSVHYADVCLRLGLQIPPLKGETLRKITSLIPAVGSFARNPVDAWRAFHEQELMEKILETAFSDQDLDMIILERLIPRPTFGSPVNKDTTEAAIDYLAKNRQRKPAIVVVDGSGEDPILAEKAARIRGLFRRARIPAYSSISDAANVLAHFVKYRENTFKKD